MRLARALKVDMFSIHQKFERAEFLDRGVYYPLEKEPSSAKELELFSSGPAGCTVPLRNE
jgi:hypothetical protein